MKNWHRGWLAAVILVLSTPASAQLFSGGPSAGAFSGMAGYIGFGVAEFSVLSPTANFRMDEGTYVSLGGEREIGKTGLFITLSANFMQNDGQTFYNYTRLDGDNYATSPGNDISYEADHWQLGLGFKFKIFPTSWFRPYGEAGGLFGYHTINYSDAAGSIVPTNGGASGGEKLEDGLTGFGYYGEAGVEVDFTETWGIRASARYQITETRPFDTLADNKVKYEVRVFQFAVARRF